MGTEDLLNNYKPRFLQSDKTVRDGQRNNGFRITLVLQSIQAGCGLHFKF